MAEGVTYTTKSEEETFNLGFQLGKRCTSGSVISLQGPLGAGKTVFAKGVASALEIKEAIVSPSFTLVQEYEGTFLLTHIDLYRIGGFDDFESIGGEELLHNKGVTLIEWSEKIEAYLPSHTLYVNFSLQSDGSREITIKE